MRSLETSKGIASLAAWCWGCWGPALIALFCCLVFSFVLWWESVFVEGTLKTLCACLAGFSCFVSTAFTAQLYVSCRLPVAARLAMIMMLIYTSLAVCGFAVHEPVNSEILPALLLLGLGGFGGGCLASWRAVAWRQPLANPKITIFWIMDVTTAIAIVLAILSALPNRNYPGLLCIIPGAMIFALIGLPMWARLLAISLPKTHQESGMGLWIAANIIVALSVLFVWFVTYGDSPRAFIGFVAAAAVVVVAHGVTELQIRWLRGCGWTFVRLEKERG